MQVHYILHKLSNGSRGHISDVNWSFVMGYYDINFFIYILVVRLQPKYMYVAFSHLIKKPLDLIPEKNLPKRSWFLKLLNFFSRYSFLNFVFLAIISVSMFWLCGSRTRSIYIYILCASLFWKRVHFLDHILLWRSKQICISRPKINERAVHVYIYITWL